MAQEELFYDSLEDSFESEKNETNKNPEETPFTISGKKKTSKIPVYCTLQALRMKPTKPLSAIDSTCQKIDINGDVLNEILSKEFKVTVSDSDLSATSELKCRKTHKKLVNETKKDLMQREKLRKTYLGIFQTKTGIVNKYDPLDDLSIKSTYGESTARSVTTRQSERSFKTEYSGPAWETARLLNTYFYFKALSSA